jgi:methionyl-tRNA formyltransferase
VDDGIDSGDIAFQKSIETSWEDTGASLFNKATKALVSLFKENYDLIACYNVPRIPQHEGRTFHYRKELKNADVIDLNKNYTGREILNLIRARMFGTDPGVVFNDLGSNWRVTLDIKKITR